MAGSERFTQRWRDEHAEAGDRALELAAAFISPKVGVGGLNTLELAAIGALSDLAAAHYAAANVRAKPFDFEAAEIALEQDRIKRGARELSSAP